MKATLTLGAQLGAAGKDKIVHRGVDSTGREWAVAKLKRPGNVKDTSKLLNEVKFLKRAAALGLAPQVSDVHSDLKRGVLVMELLAGGTLKAVLERQKGVLRPEQQERLVHILESLGGPGCDMVHGDLANPLNYVEDAAGVLHVIDFGFSRDIGKLDREVLGNSPRLNLFTVGNLLWGPRSDGDNGRPLWSRSEPPAILLAAYRHYKTELGLIDVLDRRPASAIADVPQSTGHPAATAPRAGASSSHARVGKKPTMTNDEDQTPRKKAKQQTQGANAGASTSAPAPAPAGKALAPAGKSKKRTQTAAAAAIVGTQPRRSIRLAQ